MKLTTLLQDTSYSLAQEYNDIEISGLTIDSRKVKDGDLFIAVKGRDADGHKFIQMALEKGAAAVLIDLDMEDVVRSNMANLIGSINIDKFPIASVANTRDNLSIITNRFYDFPANKFKLTGITGTNGKTSVAVILNHVLTLLGHKTGLIGTIANYLDDEEIDIDRTTPTTPDCIELGKIMRMMADKNVDDVIMEASSMGLKTKRVKSLTFDVGIFTNISPEHLDDHKTMEDYMASKLMLFKQSKASVINIDDEFGKAIVGQCLGSVITYGIHSKDSDILAENIKYESDGVRFDMVYGKERFEVSLIIPSEFAIYNVLAVAGACLQMGISFSQLERPIQDEIVVPGRYDIVSAPSGITGIIDYAHTEEALRNLLIAVKANPSYKRVISVFGCGGDRDPSKREPMGRTSGELADITIVTSDNPRTEDPVAIAKVVEKGVAESGGNYELIVDRKKAIARAVEIAQPGDAVVIAGKGHETYQILGDKTINFDDKDVFKSLI